MAFRSSIRKNGPFLDPFLAEAVDVGGGGGRRIHQHQARDAFRVAKRVFKRQHRAPRMPKQHHLVEMKMLSDLIEIGHFRFERNVFRLHVPAPAHTTTTVRNSMTFMEKSSNT